MFLLFFKSLQYSISWLNLFFVIFLSYLWYFLQLEWFFEYLLKLILRLLSIIESINKFFHGISTFVWIFHHSPIILLRSFQYFLYWLHFIDIFPPFNNNFLISILEILYKLLERLYHLKSIRIKPRLTSNQLCFPNLNQFLINNCLIIDKN